MSARLLLLLSAVLLLVGFCVPVFLAGFITISTPFESRGWPAFMISTFTFGEPEGRSYLRTDILPAAYLYIIFPLTLGFVAGWLWQRRTS